VLTKFGNGFNGGILRKEGRPKWQEVRGKAEGEEVRGKTQQEKRKRQGKVFLASSDIH
jgi:hypothetical protein